MHARELKCDRDIVGDTLECTHDSARVRARAPRYFRMNMMKTKAPVREELH